MKKNMKDIPGYVEQQRKQLYVTLAKDVKMEFVRIPAGEFWMGSEDRYSNEEPKHKVYLDEYWIGKYPVTVAQYAVFDPGRYLEAKANHPVVEVSWHDANKFTTWLSKLIEDNGNSKDVKIWLPSEAQWEKSARGTDGRTYPWGNQSPDETLCNYDEDTGDTTPVGKYSPEGDSPYGCADMAGNVLEWVQDWYDEDYYGISPSRNPTGPSSGDFRVKRGGSWYGDEDDLRSSIRGTNYPDDKYDTSGFRCAIS